MNTVCRKRNRHIFSVNLILTTSIKMTIAEITSATTEPSMPPPASTPAPATPPPPPSPPSPPTTTASTATEIYGRSCPSSRRYSKELRPQVCTGLCSSSLRLCCSSSFLHTSLLAIVDVQETGMQTIMTVGRR